jgi:hypothetical protein
MVISSLHEKSLKYITGCISMTPRTSAIYLLIVVCLMALVVPITAQAPGDQPVNVIYQTSFATDPQWITNNPSLDYWDPGLEMFHFSIEPSNGGYAYTPIYNYDKGSFTLEYDIILTSIDPGATFRLGFSGPEMDPATGPNVLTEFTNAKYGQILWLHLVTPGNKMVEVNSQYDDTISSGPTAYAGPTVNFALNKTYHVVVDYDADQEILTMTVNEKLSGNQIWSYYVNTGEDLYGMNRIYLGSIGDYGPLGIYATGYLDNVRLTAPVNVTAAPTGAVPASSPATTPFPTRTLIPKQTATLPTPYPSASPTESSLSVVPVMAAVGIASVCCGRLLRKKD